MRKYFEQIGVKQRNKTKITENNKMRNLCIKTYRMRRAK